MTASLQTEPAAEASAAEPATCDLAPVRVQLRAETPDLSAIAARFDALDLPAKLEEMLALGRRAQARLWSLALESPPLTVEELLGDAEGDEADDPPTWIWEGVNSLPFFRRFQKRVVRQDDETLAGYNEQALRWLTGPGCFTVRRARPEEPGSIVFDYIRTPTRAPFGGPKVVSSGRGLGRFVYGGMLDHMHRVSPDVMIGRAWKSGRMTNNYFLLARGPRAGARQDRQ